MVMARTKLAFVCGIQSMLGFSYVLYVLSLENLCRCYTQACWLLYLLYYVDVLCYDEASHLCYVLSIHVLYARARPLC